MVERSAAVVDRADIDRATATLLATIDAVASELHAGRRGASAPTLDSALDSDIGLDSLSRVELGQRLENRFDVTLAEGAVFDASTPRDLLRLVMKARAGRPLTVRSLAAEAAPRMAPGVPDGATTLADVLAWHLAREPGRTHIQLYDDYTDGETISHAELHAGALAVAGGLQAEGLVPGESVALMLPTGRAYFYTFFGVVLAGGVPVPIYPPVRRQQLEDHLRRQSRILASSQAVMLVTTTDTLGVARLLTAAVAGLRRVLAADSLLVSGTAGEPVTRMGSDTALLQFTSGSTGDPKGVILSHANLLANVRADGLGMAVTANDVFVSWLPLYHDMGLIGAWLGSLYHGVRLVVMSPLAFLSRPQRWLWAIHRHGGSLSAAPNFAYDLCTKRIADSELEGLDLTRWRIAANGAEPVSATTLDAFSRRFAPYGFARAAMFPVYGLAECAVGLAFPPPGRGPLIESIDRSALAEHGIARPLDSAGDGSEVLRVVSCGQPLPRHEIRVVDAGGRELPERREGRLQFRGPSATSGYFARPLETAQLFDRGWLETGDRAFIAAGELFLTGRTKDIIIRAGRNIYPAELEDAVGELDGVRKGHVAVFAAPDPLSATERVVVLAETRRREAASRDELRSRINALATELIAAPPDEIVLAPPNTVLRTSSGKVRRAACRALYERGAIGRRERAVWLQVTRLALAGALPQLRRAFAAARAWCYAGWSWAAFSALALAALVAAWLPLPRRALWRTSRALARAAGAATATRVSVRELARLPGDDTPCVVVANHQSYLDGVLLLAVLPRPPRFVIKAELAGSRLLARPLRRLGAVFVERFDGAAGIDAMTAADAVLDAGALLAVFPEGTFKRMPGVLPFHLGAFLIAARRGVPVVPVAIHGTRSILRADSWFPRRGAITVTLGDPIAPDSGDDAWRAALALRDAARRHVLAHAAEPDLAEESNEVDRP